YGFNKSHAAAYGFLTYVTAYLKAHYPGEWMAALMTSDRDDLTKVAKILAECKVMGIAILPPDVNESGSEFIATEKGIRFAITAIKGVGAAVVETIEQERKKGGAFKSLADFLKRIDTKKVGKKVVECLIESGCFDFTKTPRQALLLTVDPLFATCQRDQREKELGVISLFSLVEEEEQIEVPVTIMGTEDKHKILKREKELLGFYLTGHPLEEFQPILQRLSCVPLSRFETLEKGSVVRAAFIIETVVVKVGQKNQRKFAILTISDGIERLELPIWADLYEEKQHLMNENQILYAVLIVDRDDESIRLQCRWIEELSGVTEEMIQACDSAFDRAKSYVKMSEIRQKNMEKTAQTPAPSKDPSKMLCLRLDADMARLSHILELKKLFRAHAGAIPLRLEFASKQGIKKAIEVDGVWGVEFGSTLEEKLKKIPSLIDIFY
ncbi:MAG: DNA polymerase III subunit alpha, partial [Chlamydiales bacterium]